MIICDACGAKMTTVNTTNTPLLTSPKWMFDSSVIDLCDKCLDGLALAIDCFLSAGVKKAVEKVEDPQPKYYKSKCYNVIVNGKEGTTVMNMVDFNVVAEWAGFHPFASPTPSIVYDRGEGVRGVGLERTGSLRPTTPPSPIDLTDRMIFNVAVTNNA